MKEINDNAEYVSGNVKLEFKGFDIMFPTKKAEKPYALHALDLESNNMSEEILYPIIQIETPSDVAEFVNDIGKRFTIRIYNLEEKHWCLEECSVTEIIVGDNQRTTMKVSMKAMTYVGGSGDLMDLLTRSDNK